MQKKIYIIGIGGIGISAIARYYLNKGWGVFGSDKCDSELIGKLIDEGCDIIIGEDKNRIDNSLNLVVYTEAIPKNQEELEKSNNLQIRTLTYPQALASIVNDKKLITVAGTHGKSTTTSLISLVLKDSKVGLNSIVGSVLKEFGQKNVYFSDSDIFVIEACEYKRSFLNYKPYIGIITNIEIDHLDYYKDLDDYISAFKSYINNIKSGGYCILNGQDKNCLQLKGTRNDIKFIEIHSKYFVYNNEDIDFPIIDMKIPGDHILYDAKTAYIIGYILNISNIDIIDKLTSYSGIWRRMEAVKSTVDNNILLSDYGHHPTEIELTTRAIKNNNVDKKLVVIFQPHQYNRTLELIEGFKNCFRYVDKLIIPDIYESRDSKEDMKKINSKKLVELINHKNVIDGEGLKNTAKLIKKYDQENPDSSIILLMGAGDVDNLRYEL